MTIKELHEWAVERGFEDYDIMCTESDGGIFSMSERGTYICDIEVDVSLGIIII